MAIFGMLRNILVQHFMFSILVSLVQETLSPLLGKRFSALCKWSGLFSVFWPHWVQKDGSDPSNQVNKRKSANQLCFWPSQFCFVNRQCPVFVSIPPCTSSTTPVTRRKPKKKLTKASEKTNLTQTEVVSMFLGVNSPEYWIWNVVPKCSLTYRIWYVLKLPDSYKTTTT